MDEGDAFPWVNFLAPSNLLGKEVCCVGAHVAIGAHYPENGTPEASPSPVGEAVACCVLCGCCGALWLWLFVCFVWLFLWLWLRLLLLLAG